MIISRSGYARPLKFQISPDLDPQICWDKFSTLSDRVKILHCKKGTHSHDKICLYLVSARPWALMATSPCSTRWKSRTRRKVSTAQDGEYRNCTVLYCTVPYRTVPYRTVPYYTVRTWVGWEWICFKTLFRENAISTIIHEISGNWRDIFAYSWNILAKTNNFVKMLKSLVLHFFLCSTVAKACFLHLKIFRFKNWWLLTPFLKSYFLRSFGRHVREFFFSF